MKITILRSDLFLFSVAQLIIKIRLLWTIISK